MNESIFRQQLIQMLNRLNKNLAELNKNLAAIKKDDPVNDLPVANDPAVEANENMFKEVY